MMHGATEIAVAKHKITKVIHFCYGHRLLDYAGKCRNLHGHNGVLEVDVESDGLDRLGMVVDFGDIGDAVKTWVDGNLDHRMLLNRSDPLVETLSELGEPVYLMDGNPTAENIARHIFEQACGQGFDVTEVRLWETPTGRASYRPGR